VEDLVRERRVGRRELEDRLAEPHPDGCVHRDPRRRQQPDAGCPEQHPIPAQVHPGRACGRRRLAFLAVAILDAEAIDQERHPVEEGVEEERGWAKGAEQERCDREPNAEAGQRRALETRSRLAPEQLVAGGRDRDIAEDRGHARGSRGSLEEPRRAEQDEVRRQARQDYRDRPEHRAEQHHSVVAEPVGQDTEHRRQEQLGQEERRREEPQRRRRDRLAAMLGQLGEIDAQHRAREAGGEAQRERAGHDGPQGAIHLGQA
jgi:hypothetical protein